VVRESTNSASKPESIGASATRTLVKLKIAVLLFMVATAVGVSVLVYKHISQVEQDALEEQFGECASNVFHEVGEGLNQALGALDAFVVNLVSFARYSNSSWPYVTLPDYAARIASIHAFSQAVLVSQYHFVSTEQRVTWEKYTGDNDGWM
jgi:hypothetical protein